MTARWLKYSAYVLALLLLLALVVPWFIPLKSYIPQLEKIAAAKLGMPVKIAAVDFSLLPAPVLKLHDLVLGQDDPVQIEQIAVRPALGSLFQEVKVLRTIEVSGLRVTQRLLGFIGAMTKTRASEPQAVRVERIQLRAIQLDLDALKWGPLRADISLDEKALQSVAAGSEDGKFKLQLNPGKNGQDLEIDAKQWQIPIKPALVFEQLQAHGKLHPSTLDLPNLSGKLYGGSLHAQANLDWSRGWRVKAELNTNAVETKDIVAQLTRSLGVSGKLYAQGSFAAQAKQAAQLSEHLQGNIKFELKQGVLTGFDLAQAVKSLAGSGTRGGQTHFDTLTGTLIISGKQYQLRQLNVVSGVLSAKGDVTIAANKKLSGTIQVALSGVSKLVEVPLDVTGTLSDPVLLPNRAALAGAAAGTALMGPGFGTGIGSKAGQVLEKIFK